MNVYAIVINDMLQKNSMLKHYTSEKFMLNQNNSLFYKKEIVLHVEINITNFQEVNQEHLNTLNTYSEIMNNGDTVIINYNIPSYQNKE